jgi:hypothetical protein
MSSVVETRKTSPSQSLAPTPKVTTVKEDTPADIDIPDNYVTWTLKNQKPLPPITLDNLFENIQWLTLAILTITPSIAIYGFFTHKLRWETFVWSVIYYFITGLGKFVCSIYASFLLNSCVQVLPPATTVSGRTAPTMRPSHCSTSLRSREQAPSRARSSGGAVVTARTIAILTQTLTLTTRTRVSGTLTLGG